MPKQLQGDYYSAMVASNQEAAAAHRNPMKPQPRSSHKYKAPSALSAPIVSHAYTMEGAVYRHNPYASVLSSSSSLDLVMLMFQQSYDEQHLYAEQYGGYHHHPHHHNYHHHRGSMQGSECGAYFEGGVLDQFQNNIGQLASIACTCGGRSMLVAAVRQHAGVADQLLEEVLPELNALALDPNGCQVLRALVEAVNEDQLSAMVRALDTECILMMATSSQHTRRTLQVLFECHPNSRAIAPIVEILAEEAPRLACTQQGCIPLMRAIEYLQPEDRELIVSRLLPHFVRLMPDPFGNYVVQSIITRMDTPPETLTALSDALIGHWVELSCNKFASNVLECVVRLLDAPSRYNMILELVFTTPNLREVMQDKFGNFVLQAIIESAVDAVEFEPVLQSVQRQLYYSPFCNKIENKLRAKEAELFGHYSGGNGARQQQQSFNNSNNSRQHSISDGSASSTTQAPHRRAYKKNNTLNY